MFEMYNNLYEKCKKLYKPSYKELKEIQEEWDKCTLELFKEFNIKDIVDMWTLLDTEMSDENNYFNNFVSLLDCYYDRMNLNRWCRLQLLLGNAIDKQYRKESI